MFRPEVMYLRERREGNVPRRELGGRKAWRIKNGDRIPHALDADGTVVGTRLWYDPGRPERGSDK